MPQSVEKFIEHWKDAKGGERAQSQSFLNDFCDLLEVAKPKDNDYKFEYALRGDKATDFVDLYKRGCFVLESKQSRVRGQKKAVEGQNDLLAAVEQPNQRGPSSRAWDVLMLNARQQAENYARHLPSSHEWPPFIVVCDVGHCFEVYADFTGKGRNYTQFPDRRGFRVFIDDFRDDKIRDQFKAMWENPHALDPAKRAAKATREIASALAEVSKRLEANKHPPEEVALFLMRCLFTMFAEDSELIPENSFTDLLTRCADDPNKFMPMVTELWKQMNGGGFSVAIESNVKKFNGKLFVEPRVFPMGREDIGVLKVAAKKDWREVDPSIFGTLLEQALSPADRSSLGAHYTPRAYVERLVIATVIEPLREEWNNVQGSLEVEPAEALTRVKAYHQKLCETRVFDPACGTGNFLYVTLELMKRLEGEVLDMIERLGGQDALRLERFTVDPHQFLGLELNPRAAAIAELVLWIGYLRWHLKTKGEVPPEPILREFKNIERRDAVLAHDGIDTKGNYVNPRRPEWPEAEYIVGNPPFIGNKRMRKKLGDEYVVALKKANPTVPGSVDFVMYWWNRCAELVSIGRAFRFGLVTTNSIIQPLNRKPVEKFLDGPDVGSLALAISDHPWMDTESGAAVRVAMTVGEAGVIEGKLVKITTGKVRRDNSPVLNYSEIKGKINSRLEIGLDYTKVKNLIANRAIAQQGVILVGEGFRLNRTQRNSLIETEPQSEKRILPYLIGNDLTDIPEVRYVIDANQLDEIQLREGFPRLYQHMRVSIWEERSVNRDKTFRERWWRFGRARPEISELKFQQKRYIATCRTARHRVFVFLDESVVPDAKIIFIGSSDAFILGILQSRIHVYWSLRLGAWLGAGNDSNYNHSDIFDPFPFPDADASMRAETATIAEAIDKHRKDVQAAHPEITLTQMYNVLEKVKQNAALSDDEQIIFDDALILILKERHEELDAAVAAAYGWPAELSDDEILGRLVALNKQRAAEEAKGHVRWLRPEYQIPRFGTARDKQEQIEADLGMAPVAKTKPTFPVGAVEQTAAVMAALAVATAAVTPGELAQGFKQGKKAELRIAATLSSLARTGFISAEAGGKKFSLRRVA